jgi:hypothetical protein
MELVFNEVSHHFNFIVLLPVYGYLTSEFFELLNSKDEKIIQELEDFK